MSIRALTAALTCVMAAQAHASDLCTNAETFTLGVNSFDLNGATYSGPSNCFGIPAPDGWGVFTAPDSGLLHAEICVSVSQVLFEVWNRSSCPTGGAPEICSFTDETAPGCATSKDLVFPVIAGQNYYFRYIGSGTESGTITLSIIDPCEVYQPVSEGAHPFSLADGAPSLGGYGCDLTIANVPERWFRYTATETGPVQLAAFANITGLLELDVWDDPDCPDDPASPLACDTIDPSPTTNAVVVFNAVAGQTYAIRLAGSSPSMQGTLTIGPPPCENPTPIAFDALDYDLAAATALDPPVSCAGDATLPAQYFLFTPDFSQNVRVVASETTGPTPNVEVFENTTCPPDPADRVACGQIVSVPVTAATPYLIRVSANSRASAGFVVVTGPPDADNCSTAYTVNDLPFTYDTTGYGPSEPPNCLYGSTLPDVWFVHHPAAYGDLTVGVCDTQFAIAEIFVSDTCPPDPSDRVFCDEANTGVLADCYDTPLTTIRVGPADTVWIRSTTLGPSTGAVNVELTPIDCPADVTTTNTNPGDPGHGAPDGVIDGADLAYYVENWLAANAAVADLTTTNTNPGDPTYGSPDGAVDGADLAYFIEQWLAACA